MANVWILFVFFVVFCVCRSSARTWPTSPVAYPAGNSTASGDHIQSRIINGNLAEEYQFPWFASIRSHSPNGMQSICGGSIIAPNFVLTAAHCTRGYISYTLGFGSTNINIPLVSMKATEVVEHPNYNSDNLNFDIAVIKLPRLLQFSAHIQSIRMPSLTQYVSGMLSTSMARVCGYGRMSDESQALSPELQWVDKRIISNSQCTRTYGPSVVLMSTVCTIGGQYNEQGTCNGDSGGPLIIDEGGVWTQIGVVSFVSNQGCGSGYPAGYVRTTSFLNWIAMHTGIRIRI